MQLSEEGQEWLDLVIANPKDWQFSDGLLSQALDMEGIPINERDIILTALSDLV